MKENEIRVPSRDGRAMKAVLDMPESGVNGVAVIMHGGAATKEQAHLERVAEKLAQSGIAALRVDALDDLGYGSEALQGMTVTKRVHNIEDALVWARSQEWFRGPCLVAGHSLGGFAAGLVAASGKFDLAGAILMAPAISGDLIWKARGVQELDDARVNGGSMREFKAYPGERFTIRYEFFDDAAQYSLLRSAKDLAKIPALIVVGEDDRITPPEDAKLLAHALGQSAAYEEIGGTKHNFRGKEDELADRVDTWVRARILK